MTAVTRNTDRDVVAVGGGAAGGMAESRVEASEPDERAGRGHFQDPESEPLPVETPHSGAKSWLAS
jgi:hypothetical protein